jgi:hypothetical protein
MNLRPFVFVLATAASALCLTSSPRTADACGMPSPEEAVMGVVSSHFDALNAHDRDRMLSVWKDEATVVSVGDPTLVEPVGQAATRWLAAKQPVTFKIESIQATDKTATARVSVVFEGRKLEDTMLLTPVGRGMFRIAAKSSRPLEATRDVRAVRY